MVSAEAAYAPGIPADRVALLFKHFKGIFDAHIMDGLSGYSYRRFSWTMMIHIKTDTIGLKMCPFFTPSNLKSLFLELS